MKNSIQNFSPLYLNHLSELVQVLDSEASSLKGKSIFITGGTGFLGRWLVDTFLLLGTQVTVLTRNKEKAFETCPYWRDTQNLILLEHNLLTPLPTTLGKFELILHAANDLAFSAHDALQAAKFIFTFAAQTQSRKALFLSSGAIYSHFQFPELKNPYAEGKALIEAEGNHLAKLGNFEMLTARCFAFLGPHQDLNSHYAATQFFKALIENNTITIQGDGKAIRSYLYPSDFVRGIFKILLHGTSGHAYDLGSSEAISILELAQKINVYRRNSIPEVKLLNHPSHSPSLSQNNCYLPDLSLIENELGFQLKINLDTAIERTARFYAELFPKANIRA